jgi:hypothetical protein
MPLVDTIDRTLQIKIVYYGPGLSGKTTTLETLAQQMDKSRRGELMVLDTTGDRTLFFDWMPLELGKIRGFDVKIQLYTVPGQVRYNNTRKQVLAGVDGIVFVADSQADAVDQNRFSFMNLRENLAEQGIDLEDLPMVIQYNKQDLDNAASIEKLATKLNIEHYPHTKSVASTGEGVVETLRLITRLTLQSVKSALDPQSVHAYKASRVPLDGEGLLEHIMSAEPTAGSLSEAAAQVTGAAEPAAQVAAAPDAKNAVADAEKGQSPSAPATGDAVSDEDEAASADAEESPYAEITAEVSAEDVATAQRAARRSATQNQQRIEQLEHRLAALEKNVEEKRANADAQTAQELQTLKDRLEDGLSKLADLASRLEVAQRVLTSLGGRVAVVERRIGRLEKEDQKHRQSEELHELGRLLARTAEVLDGYAQTLSSTKSAAEPNEQSAEHGENP